MVSILLVILGHLYGTSKYPANSLTTFLAGFDQFGVQVFFVISGFLITMILLREYDAAESIDLWQFYRRRNLRILPASFFYISVMALLVHPLPYLGYAYGYMMCYVTLKPWVIAHLWSLSVEEQFYLMWPVAAAAFFRLRKNIAIGVMLAVPIVRVIFWQFGYEQFTRYFPTVADSLAAGCLLACYYPEAQKRFAWLKQTPFFISLILLTLCVPFTFSRIRYQLLLGGIVPLLIGLCVFACIERKDWILNNTVASFMGMISYSLYLWQQPFLDHHLPYHWWTTFPLNIVLALGCAIASYYLVERPFLALKDRSQAPRAVGACS